MIGAARELDEDIRRTLEAYGSDAGSKAQIVARLIRSGIPLAMAEKLVALVPLAFGRVLLAHVGNPAFSNSALLHRKDGTDAPVDLGAEPVFARSLQLATEIFHQGPRELFAPAASASAEVAAANQLLDAGGTMEDVVFTEPRFLRLTFEEWELCS